MRYESVHGHRRSRSRPGDGRRRRGTASLVLLVVALLAAACGGSGSDGAAGAPSTEAPASDDPLAARPFTEPVEITVGWPGAFEVWASAIVADGMGEFERENLEVTFTNVDSSGAIALLEQGELDVFVSSITANIFNAISSGADLRWVAPAFLPHPDSQEGIWVSEEYLDDDGDVDTEAFEGTSLGMGTGGLAASSAAILVPWLEDLGLEAQDFDYEALTGPDILIGLESGSISAGWLSDPYWTEAASSGIAQHQVGFNEDQSLSGYVFAGRLLDDDVEVGRAFLRALARTNRDHLGADYHEDEEVVGVLAEAIGVEPETIAAATGYRFPADLGFDHSVVDVLQEIWLEAGGVLDFDEPLASTDVIDTSARPEER